jgi:chromosome segregation ATPase
MITDLEREIKRLRAENKSFKNKIVELNLSVEDLTDDVSSVNSLLEKERNAKEIENILTELSKPATESGSSDDKSSIKKTNILSKIKKGKANKVSTKEYEQRRGKSAKNIKFRP